MGYEYLSEREKLFSDSGQRLFLKIRENALRLIREAGVVRMQEATKGCTGDSWQMLACLDRLVEIGEIVEIPQTGTVPGQYRIFTKNGD